MQWTFSSLQNQYDYRIFLVALGASAVGLIIGSFTVDRVLGRENGKLETLFPLGARVLSMNPVLPQARKHVEVELAK